MQLKVDKENDPYGLSPFGDSLKGLSVEAQAIAQATATFVLDSMAYTDFSWTIWHEGVRLYDFRNPGNYRNVNDIRNDSLGKQGHNSGAQGRITALSNDQLGQMLPRVTSEILNERDVAGHLRWVAHHEGRLKDLRNALGDGDFEEIRRIYSNTQSHNPNARNLLAGISNGKLAELINAL